MIFSVVSLIFSLSLPQAFQKLDKEKKRQDLDRMKEKYGISKDK